MLSQYEGNLEIFKNVMTKQLSAFGEGTKQQFFNLLTDYITFRQAINIEKLYPQQVPQDLDADNIDQIMNFVLKEKLLEILPFYQKKAQMALGDAQLEQKDFLDLIPNVYCAPASKFLSSWWRGNAVPFSTFPPHLTNNDDIPFNIIATQGGFVLESYIKIVADTIASQGAKAKLKDYLLLEPLKTIGRLSVEDGKTKLVVETEPEDLKSDEVFSTLITKNFIEAVTRRPYSDLSVVYEEMGKYKKDDGHYYNQNDYNDRLEWNTKRFHAGATYFEQVQPEYDNYLKQIKYSYLQLEEDQVYIKGNGAGVVSPLVFQPLQEDIKKYNLETMAEISVTKNNVGKLFDEFNAQKTIVASAWNKYLERAHRIDKWYKFYKEAVKKSPAPGHAPPDNAFIFERITGGKAGFPVIEREFSLIGIGDWAINYDITAQATDRRLWDEWTNFADKFNESFFADQEAAGGDFADFESQVFKEGYSVKGIKEWSFDLQLDEITKEIDTLFYPGLEVGLKFYDFRLKEMASELGEAMDEHPSATFAADFDGLNLMTTDWVKLRNTYITDRTQLIIRKNMFDVGFPLSVETLEDQGNVSFDEYVDLSLIHI